MGNNRHGNCENAEKFPRAHFPKDFITKKKREKKEKSVTFVIYSKFYQSSAFPKYKTDKVKIWPIKKKDVIEKNAIKLLHNFPNLEKNLNKLTHISLFIQNTHKYIEKINL